MARATDPRQRIAKALRSVEARLDDLPNVAATWGALDHEGRMARAIDWSSAMAKLERLSRSATEGTLSPEQLERYRHLVGRVRDSEATVAQLGLYRPRLPLDA